MSQKLLLYSIGIWFVFMILAIVNAVVRETVYAPKLGEHAGHVISTVIFIALIFIVVYLFLKNINLDYTQNDLLLIGSIWLVGTIAFEFLAGHYVFGNSWERLLTDYNLLKGRVWSLVPITVFSAPYLVDRFLR
ncbi:MAG: hypothetical protein ACQESD_06360 [Thermoplasmatota archaeon]